jgi:hypothetical protein
VVRSLVFLIILEYQLFLPKVDFLQKIKSIEAEIPDVIIGMGTIALALDLMSYTKTMSSDSFL